MSPLPFPYPGYSWSISQHLGRQAIRRKGLFELLRAASLYSADPDYADKIDAYIVAQNALPPNVRTDAQRPQIWRDYQQALAELGLIISTRFTERVVLTPIGMMWLAGMIGYSELITTQCLRDQYPNGHKQDLSQAMKEALTANGRSIPPSRVILDADAGVLIKPAVLVLRVLLELLHRGAEPFISSQECLAALVPVTRNELWPQAVNELLYIRNRGISPRGDTRQLRHVQEWFRLLSVSDIFTVDPPVIRLKPVAEQNAQQLLGLCAYHEDPSTFWIPPQAPADVVGRSWFGYYGNPEMSSQWFMPSTAVNEVYLTENYPDGVEAPEHYEEEEEIAQWSLEINPQPFEPTTAASAGSVLQLPLNQLDIPSIMAGRRRQRERTALHEQIVAVVGAKFQSNGFEVNYDPSSVDLLVSRNNVEAIVEVKTATKRSATGQMRMGVGQLAEYRSRREHQTNSRPLGLLVLSSPGNFGEGWLNDFFQSDIRLGLASWRSSDSFIAYTQGELESVLAST